MHGNPSLEELDEHFSFNGNIAFEKRMIKSQELFEKVEEDTSTNFDMTNPTALIALENASKRIAHDLIKKYVSTARLCVTELNICNQTAEVNLAVSSATCSAGGVNFGWAICQGSAQLVYFADAVSCMRDYDKCAEENEGNN